MSELRTNKIYPRDGLPAGASGGIIQMKYDSSGTGTGGSANAVTLTSTSFVDIGLEISITPTSSSNKMYLTFNLNSNNNAGSTTSDRLMIRILRGSTVIWSVDEALIDYGSSNIHVQGVSGSILDSPATTGTITYKVQGATAANSDAVQVNNNGRSDFTVMEVSG